MEHHRALRLLAGIVRDAAAVVAHGARQAFEARRRHPRHRPAPAVADDADLARGFHVAPPRPGVQHHLVPLHLRDKGAAPFDIRRRVTDVEPALDPVEERRRHGEIAVRGVAVGDAPDVAVHPEDLLHHDQPSAGFSVGFGAVGGQFVAVGGAEFDHLAHWVSPPEFLGKRKVYFVLWHNVAVRQGAPAPQRCRETPGETPCRSPNSTTISFAPTTSNAPRISTARCSDSKSCRGPISRFPGTGSASTARSRCIWLKAACRTRSSTTSAARRTPPGTIPAWSTISPSSPRNPTSS